MSRGGEKHQTYVEASNAGETDGSGSAGLAAGKGSIIYTLLLQEITILVSLGI